MNNGRICALGGCASTSFLDAAFAFRLPATGTVPHALIEIFPSEEEAFAAIADAYNRYTLLLDTYEPRQAIHTAIHDTGIRQASIAAERHCGGDHAWLRHHLAHTP